jgi:signal transduction histidine kinase
MLYPLISLFLFFQTLSAPASFTKEDCDICHKQYGELVFDDTQRIEVEFLKAQKVLECFDAINCLPPANLLFMLISYDLHKKLDLPRAGNLLARLDKRLPQLSDREYAMFHETLGNFYFAQGNYNGILNLYDELLKELPDDDIYCEYRGQYHKKIARAYEGLKDYKNQLLYLNKVLSDDCVTNAITLRGIKENILEANMILGNYENYEVQVLEIYADYLNKGDTILAISALTELIDYVTDKEQDKSKALKYSNEKLFLVESFQEASDYHKKKALKNFIESSLWISNPKTRSSFIEYTELRDSLERRELTFRDRQTYLKYQTEKVVLENEIIENRNRISYFFIAFIVGFSILFVYYLYNRNSKRELRLKLEKVLARDEERNNLAKKLHDEVATDMALLSQKLRDENLRKNLLDLRGNIRGISHELSTEDFEEISFEDQVKNLMVDMMDLGVRLDPQGLSEEDWPAYSNGFKKMLYLLIKEAVVNAHSHGKAKNIELLFDSGRKSMLLSINDDGEGFDTEAKVQGIGIRNMKKRVKEVDGVLEILSSPGNGTQLKFTLPIER